MLASLLAVLLAAVRPDQVLVVVNDSSAISVAVGSYYAEVRSIPADHVLHLAAGTTTAEVIDRPTYNAAIRDPIANYLTAVHPELKDHIKFLALTKDVPLHVTAVGGGDPHASVDSDLTLLFTGIVPDDGSGGWRKNPYFASLRSFDEFAVPDQISYLVFRLDGYQTGIDPGTGVPIDIKRLIDDAERPATSGVFVLDATSWGGDENGWMASAAADLAAMGMNVVYDSSTTFLSNQPDILGYCSWGSNDPANPGAPYYGEVPPGSATFYPGRFLPGALTTDYVSTSGRTFIDGNQNYGQSLLADLIRNGASGGNGHVWEPFSIAVARPHLLFRDYLEGFSCGEAYYHSIQYLHWMNVIVADPLMMSGIHAGLPPALQAITGKGSHRGGSTLDLTGRNFTNPAWSALTFSGVPAAALDTQSRTHMTAVAPALEPGLHDVTLTTPFGSSSKTHAYMALPAITIDGTPAPGQSLAVTMWDQPNDEFFVFVSLGTADLAVPPYGRLRLDPTQSFASVARGFFTFLDFWVVSGTIPDDPSLSGTTFYVQCLVGPSVAGGDAYLTNRADLTIR
ncbi:MAG: TIGR03790 family protein [Planctomycetota bacterium]